MSEIGTGQLILSKTDRTTLNEYLQSVSRVACESHLHCLMKNVELAKWVADEDLPLDVVRLYCMATIKEKNRAFKYVYTVVMPEHADHKKCRVSVVSPLGSSLIGRSKGDEIEWQTGGLKRVFVIASVSPRRLKI